LPHRYTDGVDGVSLGTRTLKISAAGDSKLRQHGTNVSLNLVSALQALGGGWNVTCPRFVPGKHTEVAVSARAGEMSPLSARQRMLHNHRNFPQLIKPPRRDRLRRSLPGRAGRSRQLNAEFHLEIVKGPERGRLFLERTSKDGKSALEVADAIRKDRPPGKF